MKKVMPTLVKPLSFDPTRIYAELLLNLFSSLLSHFPQLQIPKQGDLKDFSKISSLFHSFPLCPCSVYRKAQHSTKCEPRNIVGTLFQKYFEREGFKG